LKIPDDSTNSLNHDQLAAHEQILTIASKHVAHRVGDHEVAEHLPEPLIQICDVLIETISGIRDKLAEKTLAHLRQQDVNPLYDAAVGPIRLPKGS
jgi:hypothetical protein